MTKKGSGIMKLHIGIIDGKVPVLNKMADIPSSVNTIAAGGGGSIHVFFCVQV